MKTQRDKAFWLGWIAAGVIAEELGYQKKCNLSTFSRVVAKVFRVDTTGGKISFACTWGLLTWWFIPHVWNRLRGGDHDGSLSSISQ